MERADTMRTGAWLPVVTTVLLLVACSPAGRSAGAADGEGAGRDSAMAGNEDATGARRGLASSLEVAVRPDSMLLALHVTNASEDTVRLEFRSGQRYDFVVKDGSGREVWRWSEGRMFTQALGREVLEPGATLTYTAGWRPPATGGRFTAVGRVTTANAAVEQTRDFEVPGG